MGNPKEKEGVSLTSGDADFHKIQNQNLLSETCKVQLLYECYFHMYV